MKIIRPLSPSFQCVPCSLPAEAGRDDSSSDDFFLQLHGIKSDAGNEIPCSSLAGSLLTKLKNGAPISTWHHFCIYFV